MTDQINKARAFALKAHNVQTYGETFPYYKHLEDVYNVLLKFGFNEDRDSDLLVAAFLHDILEDCNCSPNSLKKEFGETIMEIVYCMTDELGRNRKERKAKTYPKIRSNPQSVILKVADRIANVEFSKSQKSPQFEMYVKEQYEFQQNLRVYQHIDKMWDHLNHLLGECTHSESLIPGYQCLHCKEFIPQ